jgi:hypothetical protein
MEFCRVGLAASLRLDPGCADNFTPLLGIFGDALAKIAR